uniref:Uncharacterized protein n=1 Tax=Cucumis melo TaxID=3656 RepID=A0A9I9CI59_CUCME
MDSDKQDDVPLAKLLKKGFSSNVAHAQSADPIIPARSHESSSSEDVFIPTLGFHHASDQEPGPLQHSPLVRLSFLVDVAPNLHSEAAAVMRKGMMFLLMRLY